MNQRTRQLAFSDDHLRRLHNVPLDLRSREAGEVWNAGSPPPTFTCYVCPPPPPSGSILLSAGGRVPCLSPCRGDPAQRMKSCDSQHCSLITWPNHKSPLIVTTTERRNLRDSEHATPKTWTNESLSNLTPCWWSVHSGAREAIDHRQELKSLNSNKFLAQWRTFFCTSRAGQTVHHNAINAEAWLFIKNAPIYMVLRRHMVWHACL